MRCFGWIILCLTLLMSVGCDLRMLDPRWNSLSEKGVSWVPGEYDSASYLHGVTDEQFAEGVPDLRKLKLRELHLQHTELTDESINGILQLTTVQRINIGGNNFSAGGLMRLAALPQLRRLRVPQGQFAAAELKRLREVMPKADVGEWAMDAYRYRKSADPTTAPAASHAARG